MNPVLKKLELLTDLYEFTMAEAYFQSGMFAPATFSLFVRDYPPNRGYFVSWIIALQFGFSSAIFYTKKMLFMQLTL